MDGVPGGLLGPRHGALRAPHRRGRGHRLPRRAFVFRKSSSTLVQARFFGVLFASSSVITPFFFGAAVGAVASGRVPAERDGAALVGLALARPRSWGACWRWGRARGSRRSSWRRTATRGEQRLARYFALRAKVAGVVLGAVSLAGMLVLRSDAPTLASRLETWARRPWP
jgi:cytochrome d ubiquinol oxidase subunit II